MKKIRFSSYSFGCRVNHAEKEEFDEQMIKAGFIYDNQQPDLFVINSCAVTHKAEREVRQSIYKLKSQKPKIKIILVGCAATYWKKNKLYSHLPIDLLVNNIDKEFLVDLLIRRLSNQSKFNLSGCAWGKRTTQKTTIFDKFVNSGRFLIKIQDGCHRFCSYCIVPYLRDLPKSRTINYIINKIKGCDKKIREVILTAINTEAYGRDTNETLVDLLKNIIRKTEITRISLGSIHPLSITQDFINFYKDNLSRKRLISYFHIPIQSGSNKILKLMKRNYTNKEIYENIYQLSNINHLAFIETDIIVGFLEEVESDFNETYRFLSKVPISKFHIFRFSKRNNTAAYYLAKRLREPKPKIKIKRAKILAELSQKKYQIFLQRHIGMTSKGLFLNTRIENYQKCLLQNQVPAFIKSEKRLYCEIKNVKIEGIKEGKLFGKIL
jgi:threonylcarbamoyladenosine tRNA methylthiotransferase MtaB